MNTFWQTNANTLRQNIVQHDKYMVPHTHTYAHTHKMIRHKNVNGVSHSNKELLQLTIYKFPAKHK